MFTRFSNAANKVSVVLDTSNAHPHFVVTEGATGRDQKYKGVHAAIEHAFPTFPERGGQAKRQPPAPCSSHCQTTSWMTPCRTSRFEVLMWNERNKTDLVATEATRDDESAEGVQTHNTRAQLDLGSRLTAHLMRDWKQRNDHQSNNPVYDEAFAVIHSLEKAGLRVRGVETLIRSASLNFATGIDVLAETATDTLVAVEVKRACGANLCNTGERSRLLTRPFSTTPATALSRAALQAALSAFTLVVDYEIPLSEVDWVVIVCYSIFFPCVMVTARNIPSFSCAVLKNVRATKRLSRIMNRRYSTAARRAPVTHKRLRRK